MNLFVYGTLREGGALDDMIVGQRVPASADGMTLFEYAGGAYPIMVATTGRPVPVIGDLMMIDLDDAESMEALANVVTMETHSGYVMRMISVRPRGETLTHQVWAFLWEQPDDDAIGPQVPSGDWLTHRALIDARVNAERAAYEDIDDDDLGWDFGLFDRTSGLS